MPDIKDPFEDKQPAKGQKTTFFPEIIKKTELLTSQEKRIGQTDILPTQIVDRLLGTGAVVLHQLNSTIVHSGAISDAQHGARGVIVGAHGASTITNTPAGTIAATDVQAAINELDTDKSATTHTHAESTITFTNITTNNASTTAHGYMLLAVAPAAGIRNIVAIDNAETIYKVTALFDTTNPADPAGTASPGTSLIAARRDHVHLGLTSAQLTDLTDSGNTTLHVHDIYMPKAGGTFTGDITITGGENIILDTTTGTKIGTATNQLLGFYGAVPVDQPATVADAATQDITGTDTVDKTKVTNDLTSCKNAINAIIDRLQELGLIA